MSSFSQELQKLQFELLEIRANTLTLLSDISLDIVPESLALLFGYGNTVASLDVAAQALPIPTDVSDGERAVLNVIRGDITVLQFKIFERIQNNGAFRASAVINTPNRTFNSNNLWPENATNSVGGVGAENTHASFARFPPMPQAMNSRRSFIGVPAMPPIVPMVVPMVLRRMGETQVPTTPFTSSKRDLDDVDEEDYKRRFQILHDEISQNRRIMENFVTENSAKTLDLFQIKLEQANLKSKMGSEFKFIEDSREGRIATLLSESYSVDYIKARKEYRSSIISSKAYNDLFNNSLKNLSHIKMEAIDLIDLKRNMDVYDTCRYFVDQFRSLPGYNVKDKDPQSEEYIIGQILTCNLFVLTLAKSTKTWFITKTAFYENYDSAIYYDIEKMLMFFSISLMPENSPQDAYEEARKLKYHDFKNFEELSIKFELCIKKNFGASVGFILNETVITDWLTKIPGMLSHPKLREVIINLEVQHRNFQVLRTAMLKAEITHHLTRGVKHDSRFNFIGDESSSSLDDIDIEEEISLSANNSHLFLIQNGNNRSWDSKRVVRNNNTYLDKVKPETYKSIGLINKCFTCDKTGHFMRDCPLNKDKPYEDWGQQHRPAEFKDYKSAYRLKPNRTSGSSYFKILYDSELEEGSFLAYIGPDGLDGLSCQECQAQLFRMC